MSGGSVALDTNRAIAVLNGAPGVAQWLAGFSEVFLPVVVIGELKYGALNSQRAKENLDRVERLIASCRVLPVADTTATVYAELRIELKRAGNPVPENDLWIAAACVESDLPLATDDAHFQVVPRLQLAGG